MVKYLGMYINDIKEFKGSYHFLENVNDGYSKIVYYPKMDSVHYYYQLFGVLSRIFGEDLVQSVGIKNIVKAYIEDALQVDITNNYYRIHESIHLLKLPGN